MTMTVKKLIAELEKIENKYLEVKLHGRGYEMADIQRVSVIPGKAFIVAEEVKG